MLSMMDRKAFAEEATVVESAIIAACGISPAERCHAPYVETIYADLRKRRDGSQSGDLQDGERRSMAMLSTSVSIIRIPSWSSITSPGSVPWAIFQ